jgi:hypothetical protein
MFASFVLYSGLFLFGTGLLSLIPRRMRRTAKGAAAIGLAMCFGALAWPAREQRTDARKTHLDQIMPAWQFNERHAIRIAASPERVFEAIRGVTANDIRFFRTLTAIRRLGRGGPENILNAPGQQPLLDVATRTGFRYLADDPPREIVVGTILVPPRAAVAAMNFLVEPDGSGSLLSTETRVSANSDSARRRFAVYWRFILPGSDIIRRMWLRAIKQRAER